MKTIRKSISINASPRTTYYAAVDPKRMPDWLEGLESVRSVEGFAGRQKCEWRLWMLDVPLHGKSEVVFEQPERQRRLRTGGALHSVWTIAVDPRAGGSKLTLTIEYDVPSPLLEKYAEASVVERNERAAEASVQRLREIVESEARVRRAAE